MPPTDLANFHALNRAEVMTFFQRYVKLEEGRIQKIEALWLKGFHTV